MSVCILISFEFCTQLGVLHWLHPSPSPDILNIMLQVCVLLNSPGECWLVCWLVCLFEQAFSLVRCRLHVLSQLLSVVVPRQCRLQRLCHALGLPLATRFSPGPGDGLCYISVLSALLCFFGYRKCMWQLEVKPRTVLAHTQNFGIPCWDFSHTP